MGQGVLAVGWLVAVFVFDSKLFELGKCFIIFCCEVVTILTALLIETILVAKGQTCPHTYPAEFSWPVAPELSS